MCLFMLPLNSPGFTTFSALTDCHCSQTLPRWRRSPFAALSNCWGRCTRAAFTLPWTVEGATSDCPGVNVNVDSNAVGWVRCAPCRQISQLSQLGKLCFTMYQAQNTWLHFENIHCRSTAEALQPQTGPQPLWSGWSWQKLAQGTAWMSWHQHQLFGPGTLSCQTPVLANIHKALVA